MKKQFFLLLAALLLGTSFAFGQGAVKNSDPKPTNCITDALHPVAGVPYNYAATVAGGTGTYEWWATKDPNFITAPGVTNMATRLTTTTGLITTSANYGVTGQTGSTVTITWSDDILSKTKLRTGPSTTTFPSATFVAVHYTGSPAECADNFKVYELDPINAFTVDIKNIEDENYGLIAYDTKDDQCPAGVASATYTVSGMQYDYGVDYMYYEVVAANFTNFWVPTFTISNTATVQTYTVEYTYTNPSTWKTTPPTWAPVVNGTTHFNVDPSVTNTNLGVSVYLRLTLTNHNYEGLALRTIRLAADGQNSVGIWDIVNSATACVQTTGADQNDVAEQDMKARPTVPSTTTSPITPNTQLVPGNEVNN